MEECVLTAINVLLFDDIEPGKLLVVSGAGESQWRILKNKPGPLAIVEHGRGLVLTHDLAT